jgi:predicted MFS family arabinose efflux permease
MAVMFTAGADLLVISPTLPQMADDLGVSVERGSAWVSAYAAATAGFALLFGPISDRYGRRRVLLLGLLTLGAGTLVAGFAHGFVELVVARFVAGAGAGMLVTSITSFVGDHFEARERAVAMGWVMSGFFLSLIIAVPVGAFLAEAVGWRQMFVVVALFGWSVGLAFVLTVGSPRYEVRSRRLSLGSAMAGYASLVRRPASLGVLLFSGSVGASMTMFSVYTSPWLAEAYGMSTADRGLIYAVGGPALLIAGPLSGRWANALGRVRLVAVGTVAMASMLLGMPVSRALSASLDQMPWEHWPRWGTVPLPVVLPTAVSFFLVTCAGSIRAGPFMTLALEVVPAHQRGAMSALRSTFNHGGAGVGASLGAVIWSSVAEPYPMVCVAAAATTLLGLWALWTLVRAAEGPPTEVRSEC